MSERKTGCTAGSGELIDHLAPAVPASAGAAWKIDAQVEQSAGARRVNQATAASVQFIRLGTNTGEADAADEDFIPYAVERGPAPGVTCGHPA